MDAFARGLKIAAAVAEDGQIAEIVKQRYASWDSGIGAEIANGKKTMKDLADYMLKKGNPDPNASGRAELIENILNTYL